MANIIINNIPEDEDYAEACRWVAKAIDNGETNGILGWSSIDWYIEK